MEDKKTKKSWIALILAFIVILVMIACMVNWELVSRHPLNTINAGVLYLNYEDIYVYSSLESALTDANCEDGAKPLKDFLPEILAEGKLVYLEGTKVGIFIDKKITQKEISGTKNRKNRIVYKLGDYFLTEN